MFEGYLQFGGVEVVNIDRLLAYVKAGLHPPGVHIESPFGDCNGLGAALGHAPYTMPALDAAPWYDVDDPATHGFAGVLPLEVTGLAGSTRAVAVEELIGDGGVPQLARRSSRTISVSALLVGETDEAVHAGLTWLTTVLHRECQPGSDCSGATLTGFTTCPGPIGEVEDREAATVAHVQAPGDAWHIEGGEWNYTTGTLTVTPDDDADPDSGGIEGGTPASTVDPGIEGGTPASTVDPGIHGGRPADFILYGLAASPTVLSCLSLTVADWTITPTTGSVTVRLGAVDAYGNRLEWGSPITVTGATALTWTREHAPWDAWRPAVWLTHGADVALTVNHRPDLDTEACLAPHRRTYANVTCVSSPTQVARLAEECGAHLLQVEWTWVAGDPHLYTTPTTLVAGLSGTTAAAPASQAAGVTYSYEGTVTAAATACPAPGAASTCALDPTYPGFTAPPAAPVIPDPGAVSPTSYHRSLLTLDPSAVPAGVGALTFTLANDATAKRGVRIRFWTSTDPDFATVTECDFASEAWVNYIGPDVSLVIDTVGGTVSAVCADSSVDDARSVMRGPYKGPFVFPTVSCGDRYFITVDTPTSTGTLDWSLTLAGREG